MKILSIAILAVFLVSHGIINMTSEKERFIRPAEKIPPKPLLTKLAVEKYEVDKKTVVRQILSEGENSPYGEIMVSSNDHSSLRVYTLDNFKVGEIVRVIRISDREVDRMIFFALPLKSSASDNSLSADNTP
jgi:hypothetical protein